MTGPVTGRFQKLLATQPRRALTTSSHFVTMRNPENRPARAMCFTLYAPSELGDDAQQTWLRENALRFCTDPPALVRFIVCQLERGATSQRLHLQGYLQVRRPSRFRAVLRLLHPRLSLRVADGTADQNIVYCTKEDTRVDGPWRHGAPTSQGQRTDLAALHAALQSDVPIADVWESHFTTMAKYHRAATQYRNVRERAATRGTAAGSEPPVQQLEVYVYWGPTGTGKTRRAHYEGEFPCRVSLGGDATQQTWFEGYEPGRDLLFDEFTGQIPIDLLKQYLDIYPVELPYKGGMVPRRCRRVFLTSQCDPQHWYPRASNDDRAALFRRFTRVEHMVGPGIWTPPAGDGTPVQNVRPADPEVPLGVPALPELAEQAAEDSDQESLIL